MAPESLGEAIRYWEPRRIWYNLALTALAGAWVLLTWPHFRHALTLHHLLALLVLAALANLCYSAAYLVDVPMQRSSFNVALRRRRWALWLLGTLLAVLIACYWIADEIYPDVDAASTRWELRAGRRGPDAVGLHRSGPPQLNRKPFTRCV